MKAGVRVVLAAVAILSLGMTGTASAGGKNHDSVNGGGQNNPPNPDAVVNHFSVSAHSDPNGEDAHGEAHFKATESDTNAGFWGDVVCLRVAGNQATVIFEIRHTQNGPANEFDYDVMYLQDNGNPVNGTPVDQVKNQRFRGDIPTECPDPINPGTPPLTHGNIVINDAA